MMLPTRMTLLVTALLGTALIVVDAADAQDTITLRGANRRGNRLIGTVTDVSPTELTIRVSGDDRKVPANDVLRLSLAGEPTGLRQARAAVQAGQYEQALEALETVDLPSSATAVMRQELGFYRILARSQLALLGGGDPEQAIDDVLDFLRQDRNTFHFFEAVELLGDLSQMAGKFDNAVRYYEQLARAPWPEYQLKSVVMTASALKAQGKFDDAATQYEKVLEIAANEPAVIRQQTLSRIGLAACHAERGQVDDAIATLEDVIAKNDPDDAPLFAQAYLALGTSYRKANRTLDAVLAYLHIDLLFYGQRDAHAEALYYLSKLWPQVDQPARGVDARQLLLERYAGTVWAQKVND